MFGIGFSEIVVIVVIALLVLGPERLPSLARVIGRGIRDLKRAAQDYRDDFDLGLDEPSDSTDREKRPPSTPDSGADDADTGKPNRRTTE